jgi:hypothetical protein
MLRRDPERPTHFLSAARQHDEVRDAAMGGECVALEGDARFGGGQYGVGAE